MHLILADAFEIVLELARQNVADETDMPEGHARQIHAINMVEDLAVNHLGKERTSISISSQHQLPQRHLRR